MKEDKEAIRLQIKPVQQDLRAQIMGALLCDFGPFIKNK